MPYRRFVAFAFGVASAFCATREAFAQSPADARNAAEFFRAAKAAYDRGDSRAAALAFEEAYRRAPRPTTLVNAGIAWQVAGEPARAADAYDKAIRDGGLDADVAKDARARLTKLDALLGKVSVVRPEGDVASVAHVEWGKIPLTVHVSPGDHVVRVRRLDATVVETHVSIGPGQLRTLEVAPAPPQESMIPSARISRQSPRGDDGRLLRTLGFVGVGAAAGFSVAALVLGIAGVGANNAFDASGHLDEDLRTRAITLRTLTNVAWGAAAVTGISGVTLLLIAPRKASNLAIGVGTATWKF